METIIVISFFILFDSFVFPQDKQKEFIEALINNSENLEEYVDKDELTKSTRLGINYDSVMNKFLISYDIDEKIKAEVNKNGLKYEVKTNTLDNEYSLSEFYVPTLNYSKHFYFKNSKWISPVTYYSKDWATKTSKYFIFKISEPKYFNDYCVNKLDEFVDSLVALLEFDEHQKQLLEKEKIYYILCKDEKEIEEVTGFNTRGIFLTAFVEVVTTYNTHYHELAHLLMNYKLKNLSLYTLPFFQEGFAVAVGGRGGMAKRVVLDIGYYLQESGILTYDSIITNEGFYNEDASLTYPVAGLYNAFLLKELGAGQYLKLYRCVNTSIDNLDNILVSSLHLPDYTEFLFFLKDYSENPCIYVDENDTNKIYIELGNRDSLIVKAGMFNKIKDYFKFSIRSPFVFSPQDFGVVSSNYISRDYIDITGDTSHISRVLKYGITADTNSVNLYNFYTNEVIASYIRNFTIDNKSVPLINSKYEFFIRDDVFENDLENVIVIKFK